MRSQNDPLVHSTSSPNMTHESMGRLQAMMIRQSKDQGQQIDEEDMKPLTNTDADELMSRPSQFIKRPPVLEEPFHEQESFQ